MQIDSTLFLTTTVVVVVYYVCLAHSKERSRIRASIRRERKTLTDLVDRYNNLGSVGLDGFMAITQRNGEDEPAELPWITSAG